MKNEDKSTIKNKKTKKGIKNEKSKKLQSIVDTYYNVLIEQLILNGAANTHVDIDIQRTKQRKRQGV